MIKLTDLTIAKRNGVWFVLDSKGYDLTGSFGTKQEATIAARVYVSDYNAPRPNATYPE